MKKKVILFVLLTSSLELFTLNCFAQPNAGFENWTTESSYENPNGWQTLNFLSQLSPPNPISALKVIGNDVHSGFFALKLKTVHISTNPWPGIIEDTTGGIFTGKITPIPFSYTYGFPYSGRPEKMEFWTKYFPVGNDTAAAAIVLQRWNGTGRDTIAFGEIIILSTPEYTAFQVELTYVLTALPDTAAIGFMASKNQLYARVNSTLYLDDVSLTGWVGIDEQKIYSDKVKIFPNPARDNVTILTEIKDADNVRIFDASGKSAGIYNIRNYATNVNTSFFATGIYCFEIRDKKNKIITTGKFNVIK